MKSKLLLRLALVLSVGLLGCSTTQKNWDKAPASGHAATVLVRLVKVTVSPSHVPTVIATFEPIRIKLQGGGGGKNFVAPYLTETVIGDQFTVEFRPFGPGLDTPNERTLSNVIQSCLGKPETDPSAPKLHLVLLIPEQAPKDLIAGERDFSQWVIQSIDLPK